MTDFAGLFGLRPTFRRPERRADALAGLGMARGGSGGEMSLAPFESTAEFKTLGAAMVEVARSGRVVAISALDKAPNFMCIRTRGNYRLFIGKRARAPGTNGLQSLPSAVLCPW